MLWLICCSLHFMMCKPPWKMRSNISPVDRRRSTTLMINVWSLSTSHQSACLYYFDCAEIQDWLRPRHACSTVGAITRSLEHLKKSGEVCVASTQFQIYPGNLWQARAVLPSAGHEPSARAQEHGRTKEKLEPSALRGGQWVFA